MQDVRQERCRQLVLVGVDAQRLARRFLAELCDDERLASLLQLAKLVAHINQDQAFGFVQTILCLLDGLVFFRKLILLSSPIKYFPLDDNAQTGKVLWDDVFEITQRQIGEADADIGDVLGLLDAAIDFSFLQLARISGRWSSARLRAEPRSMPKFAASETAFTRKSVRTSRPRRLLSCSFCVAS